MKDIIYQEAETKDFKLKVGILVYTGSGDPVKNLDEAVEYYVGHEGYNEFIDANMDNPWVRLVVKGINDIEQVTLEPETYLS